MEKIKIITDSTADIPMSIFREKDIEVLPLLINFGEESYLDGVEINPKHMFKRIEEEDVLPTTAQVTPNRFYDCFKKYLEEGYKIVSIHLSSNMSGTYQSACIAKNMLETEDIEVIDSQNVTSGLGLLVLKAHELKEQGINIHEIKEQLDIIKDKISASLAFESLDNLVRGGRISKTAGVIGSVLGIRLILDVQDGMMAVKNKVRGSKKAIRTIIEEFESSDRTPDELVALLNAENEEIFEGLKKYLVENNIEHIECEVGCSVGIHSGPKAAGLFFIRK
ncbi:DegV family protein [Inconstantimicrobium mannanitabidum]|uniref:DegV domain-containing protein n=1 Tax=Inconstantimicrobium mannanitabidum TaxID=1604901 RepID=A0ACB5REM0_9CLOT|nr:DegV family protein [Clostridium sp. TW13]GKX67725.1 DegV domain-containing protein [Clostridium sp. TW13]